MKNKLYASLVVVALLFVGVWNVYAQRTAPVRQTWEYKVDLEGRLNLNSLGAEGWELVTSVCVGNNANNCWLYLKRAK